MVHSESAEPGKRPDNSDESRWAEWRADAVDFVDRNIMLLGTAILACFATAAFGAILGLRSYSSDPLPYAELLGGILTIMYMMPVMWAVGRLAFDVLWPSSIRDAASLRLALANFVRLMVAASFYAIVTGALTELSDVSVLAYRAIAVTGEAAEGYLSRYLLIGGGIGVFLALLAAAVRFGAYHSGRRIGGHVPGWADWLSDFFDARRARRIGASGALS